MPDLLWTAQYRELDPEPGRYAARIAEPTDPSRSRRERGLRRRVDGRRGVSALADAARPPRERERKLDAARPPRRE